MRTPLFVYRYSWGLTAGRKTKAVNVGSRTLNGKTMGEIEKEFVRLSYFNILFLETNGGLGGRTKTQKEIKMERNILAFQYGMRNKNLKELGYKNYQDFLKSETWQKIKERFESKNKNHWRKCYCCNIEGQKLVLHHIKYGGLQKIKLGGIVPVCNLCHQLIHEYHRKHMNLSIKQATTRIKRKWIKEKKV